MHLIKRYMRQVSKVLVMKDGMDCVPVTDLLAAVAAAVWTVAAKEFLRHQMST